MKNKYVFVTALLLALSFLGLCFTRGYRSLEEQKEGEELKIVTSFYPMYVAVLNIAGDCEGVTVENLSEPQTGCLHDYQLTPQDMILLSEADIFVVNGGGIEGFLSEVAKAYPELDVIQAGASVFKGETEQASELGEYEEYADRTAEVKGHGSHAHDNQENAHAWMSIPHYIEQIETIRDGLGSADPAHADLYEEHAAAYLTKVHSLKQEAEEVAKAAAGEKIVIFHQAFEYLAEDYDMQVAGELNLDEERQVSAGEIADILKIIEEKKIRILLAEDLYGKDMGDTIEKETDCNVYYLDTLVRGAGTKDGWLTGMKKNIQILKEALCVCVKLENPVDSTVSR